VEVDGKRFNVSVDQFKPAYSTAQQEHPSSKPDTVQSTTEPSSSKKTHSALKTYPSATKSKKKKTVTFQRE